MTDNIIDYELHFSVRTPEMDAEISKLIPQIREMAKDLPPILISSTPNGSNTLYEEYKKLHFFSDWQKIAESVDGTLQA